MSEEINISPHVVNAEIFIGAALNADQKEIITPAVSVGLRPDDMPKGNHRDAYRAIVELIRDNKTVSPEAVYTHTAKAVPLEWLKGLSDKYGNRLEEMSQAAETVVKYAEAIESWRTTRELTQKLVESPSEARSISSEYGAKLMRPRSRGTLRSFPADIRRRAGVSATNVLHETPTGLTWLDTMIEGGLQPKYQLGIGSRQKGRKTTFVRNMILGATRVMTHDPSNLYRGVTYAALGSDPTDWNPRAGVKVAFLAFENDQVRTYYDFVSMLAFEYLWKTGGPRLCNERLGSGYLHEWCHSSKIMKADLGNTLFTDEENGVKGWNESLQQACRYAFWAMERLSTSHSLAIYDAETHTGDLNYVSDLERILLEHTALYCDPDDHFIYATDYIGLVRKKGEGNKYAVQQEVNSVIKESTHKLLDGFGATALTVGQYNSQTKRDMTQGQNADPMVDNNPDIRRIAQTFIQTDYDHEETEQRLTVSILDNRRGRMGSKAVQHYQIHPASGYIYQTFDADALLERS